jgi:hypothetical protein
MVVNCGFAKTAPPMYQGFTIYCVAARPRKSCLANFRIKGLFRISTNPVSRSERKMQPIELIDFLIAEFDSPASSSAIRVLAQVAVHKKLPYLASHGCCIWQPPLSPPPSSFGVDFAREAVFPGFFLSARVVSASPKPDLLLKFEPL